MKAFLKNPGKYVTGKWNLYKAEQRFQDVFLQQSKLTKKQTIRLFKTESKGFIRFVFALTPPMGGTKASIVWGKNIRTKWSEGRAAGRKNIRADLTKAFKIVRPKVVEDAFFSSSFNAGAMGQDVGLKPQQALAKYLTLRNDKKRVVGKHKIPISRETKNFVQKAIISRQGWVASGWNAAADALGFGRPQWVSKWGRSLNQKFTAVWESERPYFEAVNGTNHKDSDVINRRIAGALSLQTAVMLRRIKALAEKQLKSSLG